MQKHECLGPKAAAQYLDVSRVGLALLEKTGKLPSYRTGSGNRRYKLADLNRIRREQA